MPEPTQELPSENANDHMRMPTGQLHSAKPSGKGLEHEQTPEDTLDDVVDTILRTKERNIGLVFPY